MPEIIIIAGASGSGKSFLARHMPILEEGVELVKKLSTRKPREYELETPTDTDLEFVDEQKVLSCEYRYVYADAIYGIKKSRLAKVLRAGRSPFLIVRDSSTISKIKADFPGQVFVAYVRSTLDQKALQGVLQQQGLSEISADERLRRDELDLQQFLNFRDIYNSVIANDYNPDNFIAQFRHELGEFRLRSMIVPNYAFLIMAFDEEMDETHQAIIQAPRLSNHPYIHIERIDAIRGDYHIYDQIISCIRKSEFIIADLTLEKPNVYFELGYARGIGKEVLSLARRGSKLHFDIQGVRTDFYNGPIDAQNQVIKYIEARSS
jgi:guanylate kinase